MKFFKKPEENLNIGNARSYWVCDGFLQKFRYSGRKNIITYISNIFFHDVCKRIYTSRVCK